MAQGANRNFPNCACARPLHRLFFHLVAFVHGDGLQLTDGYSRGQQRTGAMMLVAEQRAYAIVVLNSYATHASALAIDSVKWLLNGDAGQKER